MTYWDREREDHEHKVRRVALVKGQHLTHNAIDEVFLTETVGPQAIQETQELEKQAFRELKRQEIRGLQDAKEETENEKEIV